MLNDKIEEQMSDFQQKPNQVMDQLNEPNMVVARTQNISFIGENENMQLRDKTLSDMHNNVRSSIHASRDGSADHSNQTQTPFLQHLGKLSKDR